MLQSKEQEQCTSTESREGCGVAKDATQTKNELFISGSAHAYLSEETAAVEGDGGRSAIGGGDVVAMRSGDEALAFAEAVKNNGNESSETPASGYSDERKCFEMQGDKGAHSACKISISTDEGHEAEQAAHVMVTAGAEALRAAQLDLSQANSTLLALQGALRNSQDEVARLRDMVSTQENKARRQEENMACLRCRCRQQQRSACCLYNWLLGNQLGSCEHMRTDSCVWNASQVGPCTRV